MDSISAAREDELLSGAWAFLEHWAQMLAEPDALTRLPEFVSAAEGLRATLGPLPAA